MRFNVAMPSRLMRRLSERSGGVNRTFRHPSSVVVGTLGPLYLAVRALLENDPDLKWLWLGGAVLVGWCAWTSRMTLGPWGVTVQNCWIPRTYAWRDIRTARMTTPRSWDPVLAIYLKDGRRIRVWAVSEVKGIGGSYCARAGEQLEASLREARKRR